MARTRSRILRREGSPFWHAVYTDHHGNTQRRSTGCRDHAAASAWLAARELDRVRADAGITVAVPAPILRASAEYLVQNEAIWSAGWSASVDAFFARRVIPHFGGDRVVSSITRADVETFRAAQIGTETKAGRAVTNATVNRLMAALAAFGNWCLVEGRGYHAGNPWAKHPPLPEDDIPVPTVDDAQLEKLLAALDDPDGTLPQHGRRKNRAPWRLIVEFARETGLRRGELSRLARPDIDTATETVWVISTRKRGMTKARKKRPIPLSPLALDILAALPQRDDGLVFGRIPDPRRALARAAKAAGLERVWLHLFRHLFASRLAERGAGRAELREAGGWSSSRMADRYTYARLERLRGLISGSQGHTRDTQKEKATEMVA